MGGACQRHAQCLGSASLVAVLLLPPAAAWLVSIRSHRSTHKIMASRNILYL